MPSKPFISITSDFGVQSQGVGIMKGVALGICPEANVVHLMHGISDFDLIVSARTMETVVYLPVGFHVCVVDPGVGTQRKCIAIKVGRGDVLIGPDNGILMPATRFLAGAEKVIEITNPQYMRQPISPIFHGRDIFVPAAAHLARGVLFDELGPEIDFEKLVPAPYEEAEMKEGMIEAQVIHINKFGSFHLNIQEFLWDKFKVKLGERVLLEFNGQTLEAPFVRVFGDVEKGESLIMKDDYSRMEVALNQGSFISCYKIKVGDQVVIRKLR